VTCYRVNFVVYLCDTVVGSVVPLPFGGEKKFNLHFEAQDCFPMKMKALQTSGLTHPTKQCHFLSNTFVKTARLISNNFIYSVFCLYGLDVTRLSCSLIPVDPTVFSCKLQMKKSRHSVARFQTDENSRYLILVTSFQATDIKANITLSKKNSVSKLFFFILYNDQQMHNYFTNYHTATCFDTIASF